MVKQKYDWKANFQRGLGKKVSRMFFTDYQNREILTSRLHPDTYKEQKRKKPNKVYIDRNIHNLCTRWEKEGFIERSNPINVKTRWGRKIKVYLQTINLEPFYRYCKESYNIKFTDEEKIFINRVFEPSMGMRWIILTEYPEEDIINAILKFYIKHYPMPYNDLYRNENLPKNVEGLFNKEFMDILKRAEKDAEEVTNLDISQIKERPQKAKEYREYLEKTEKDPKRILVKTILYGAALFYITNYKKNPKLVSNVDSKFMKALGIL